jgi:hypothetical protein
VQKTNDKQSLFFVQLNLITGTGIGKGCIETFIERFNGVEDFGKNEIEEGLELGQVVLKRRTSQDEVVLGVVVSCESLNKFALSVLHSVSLSKKGSQIKVRQQSQNGQHYYYMTSLSFFQLLPD